MERRGGSGMLDLLCSFGVGVVKQDRSVAEFGLSQVDCLDAFQVSSEQSIRLPSDNHPVVRTNNRPVVRSRNLRRLTSSKSWKRIRRYSA